jgi:hypothetical protein
MALNRKGRAQYRPGLGRQANRPQSVIAADFDDEAGDGRVQMHVLVRVDVVEGEAGGAEGLELGADLLGELAPNSGREEIPKTGTERIIPKTAVASHQAAQPIGRRNRAAADQYEMQPDPKPWQPARSLNRIGDGWRPDHQARGRQDAVAMRLFDGLVDRYVQAEIVGAEDEALRERPRPPRQLGSSRSRRNWKNSTPSRTRRRIISGLRSISPSSEAIFRRRK